MYYGAVKLVGIRRLKEEKKVMVYRVCNCTKKYKKSGILNIDSKCIVCYAISR